MATKVRRNFKKNIYAHDFMFKSDREITNPETIAAMEEYYEIKEHPERYKRYSSFKEGLAEVLVESVKTPARNYSPENIF